MCNFAGKLTNMLLCSMRYSCSKFVYHTMLLFVLLGLLITQKTIAAAGNQEEISRKSIHNVGEPIVSAVLNLPVIVGSLDTTDLYETVVVGDYAYLADTHGGFKIVNVADKTAPVLVGSLATDGLPHGVVVAGNYAYLGDYDRGLKIVNIEDPSSPFLVGSLDTDGHAGGVDVVDEYVYLGDREGGLKIIDVTDKAAPVLVSTVSTSSYSYSVKVVGNYAYVADWQNGLKIVDITDKTTPVVTGSLDTNGGCELVVVVGNCASLADRSGGLKEVDITDPTAPVLIGSVDTEGLARHVAVVGDYAYVANCCCNPGSFVGLKIYDISNPASPALSGSLNTDAGYSVTVVGDYAYISDGTSGLKIARVQNNKPVVSDIPKSGTEDTAVTFHVADFTGHFSDSDGDSLTKIKIMDLPANGTLKLSGVAVTTNQEIVAGDLDNLTFDPASNWSGNTAFSWKGYDGYAYSDNTANVNISISGSQDSPVVSDISKSGARNTTVTFSSTDFTNKFSDSDGDSLVKIQVPSLPDHGILKLLGSGVVSNQEIITGDLDNLTFDPTLNWSGNTTFTWKGHDGYAYSVNTANVNIDISGTQGSPVISDLFKSGIENTDVTFSSKDFSDKFSDPDGDNLAKIKITGLPKNGILKLSGVAVVTDQEIDTSALDGLVFQPFSDWWGDTSFKWKGCDGALYSSNAANGNIAISGGVSATSILGSNKWYLLLSIPAALLIL